MSWWVFGRDSSEISIGKWESGLLYLGAASASKLG